MKKPRKEERTEQKQEERNIIGRIDSLILYNPQSVGSIHPPAVLFSHGVQNYQHFGNLTCSLQTTKQTKDQVPWKHAEQMHFCTCGHLCTSAQCPGNPTAQKCWRPAGLTSRIANFLWWHSILKIHFFSTPPPLELNHRNKPYKHNNSKYFELLMWQGQTK